MSKVALVIGGTGGLGRACAEDLASTGYSVIVAGRNKSKGDDIVAYIKSKGGKATFLPVDMTDPASIKQFHQDAVKTYGRLDAAINAAGLTGDFCKLVDSSAENTAKILQINLAGVIGSMQEQIRAMQSNPGGSRGNIVNFTSIYGLHGCKFGSIYSATKHALVGITKSAALEYSNPTDNILVNAVAPGLIVTKMTAVLADPSAIPEGEMKNFIKTLPTQYAQQRFGEVEDVARGVRYLLESAWVTGTVLEIEGGFGAK
ncbi:hypothetical protein LTR95_001024 [Oleoguttula sp. CCFEE 5521]